jgi:hypothetical protein
MCNLVLVSAVHIRTMGNLCTEVRTLMHVSKELYASIITGILSLQLLAKPSTYEINGLLQFLVKYHFSRSS